jgi:hypothetical protein
VTADGTTLYFASNRGHDGGYGRTDIYVARRMAADGPFGEPALVSEVNAAGSANRTSWVSPDGCRLYFASDRASPGSEDIYVAEKPATQ